MTCANCCPVDQHSTIGHRPTIYNSGFVAIPVHTQLPERVHRSDEALALKNPRRVCGAVQATHLLNYDWIASIEGQAIDDDKVAPPAKLEECLVRVR